MVHLDCSRVIPHWSYSFLGSIMRDSHFPACTEMELLHVACSQSGNLLFRNRFHVLEMVQFEYLRTLHPLVSFSSGLPFLFIHWRAGVVPFLPFPRYQLYHLSWYLPNADSPWRLAIINQFGAFSTQRPWATSYQAGLKTIDQPDLSHLKNDNLQSQHFHRLM